jgi:hypothetical protein
MGPCGVIPPGADADADEAAVTRGKQGGLPGEQALGGQGRGTARRGVQHHIHDPFDMAIHRGQRADLHAQAAGDGRTHRLCVEPLALDLAGPDHIFRERPQAGPVAQNHADIGQATHEQPLGAADVGQQADQR